MTETVQSYAHEVVPYPGEDAPLREQTRYQLARAQGWFRAMLSGADPDRDVVFIACYDGQVALLLVAIERGMTGEEAFRWAHDRWQGEALGEWLWQLCEEYDIDPDAIRAYERPVAAKET